MGVLLAVVAGVTIAVTVLVFVLVQVNAGRCTPIVEAIRTADGRTVLVGCPGRVVIRRLRRAAVRAELFALRRNRADVRVWASVIVAVVGGAAVGLSVAGWTVSGLLIGIAVTIVEFVVLLPGLVGMGVLQIGYLPCAWIVDADRVVAVWTFRASGVTVTGNALHAWPVGSGAGTMLLGAASSALAARGFTVHANAANATLARLYIRRCGFGIDRMRRRRRPRLLGVPLIKHPTPSS